METFWLENGMGNLVKKLSLIPDPHDSIGELLNTISRLTIVGSAILFLGGYEYWYVFLLGLMLLILGFAYLRKQRFTRTPTYLSEDSQQLTVAPLLAEEWQLNPTTYDIVESVEQPENQMIEPLTPQNYPYGQYLTRTNFLPHDEMAAQTFMGNHQQVREFMNSTFTRNDIANRDNLTRIYKLKLQNRFRHNCNDTFSTFSSS